jgi:hypothetical protein
MDNKTWQELRDSYPPLENEFDREERTAFNRWVEDMGFDGIIQISGAKNDKQTESN